MQLFKKKFNFFFFFIVIFIFNITDSYAYMDPVSTGIFYQIIVFIFSGILLFFTKIKKIINFFEKEFNHIEIFLIFFSIIPIWIFNIALNTKEKIIISFSFLFLFLFIYFLLKKIKKNFNKIYIFVLSFCLAFGFDDKLGLASLINYFDLEVGAKYISYFLFFISLIFLFYILLKLNFKKIINISVFFLIIISFQNLFFNKKNINLFFKYEEIKNKFSNQLTIAKKKITKPTIVIIFDEMSSPDLLDKNVPNHNKIYSSFELFLKKFNFVYYPKAYSIYASTADSIPSLINFDFEYNYKNLDIYRNILKSHIFFSEISQNKLFDLYKNKKISVYQNFSLNVCNRINFTNCNTANPFSNKKNYVLKNYKESKINQVFTMYDYQGSIFSKLLTRFMENINLISIVRRTAASKIYSSQIMNAILSDAIKKNDLIFAHIDTPHKPFIYDENCNYKKYKNNLFLGELEVKRIHNIEQLCILDDLNKLMMNLKNNNLLSYYNIILTSDHGARNSKYKYNILDWHSSFFAIRKINKDFKKDDEVNSIQYLFSNFFLENNLKSYKKKYWNLYYNEYVDIENIFAK